MQQKNKVIPLKIEALTDKKAQEKKCFETISECLNQFNCTMVPQITILGLQITSVIHISGENSASCMIKIKQILNQFDCDMLPRLVFSGIELEAGIIIKTQERLIQLTGNN